jgi:hypothetical protein
MTERKYFFIRGAKPPVGPGPHYRGFTITLRQPHLVGLLWTSDKLDAETVPDNGEHSQETNIHATGGIRTRNPSKLAAAELHLIPHCHWDLRSAGTASLILRIDTRWRWGRFHVPALYPGRSTPDTQWLGC